MPIVVFGVHRDATNILNERCTTHIHLALYGQGTVCIQVVTKMLMNFLR